MNKEDVRKFNQNATSELQKLSKFLALYYTKPQELPAVAVFDSLMNAQGSLAKVQLPEVLEKLLASKAINNTPAGIQAVFDGMKFGIDEYKKRNGGENPPTVTVLSAFDTALNTFTEHATDPQAKKMFDALSFDHHEALSMVHAPITVTIMTNIANSLPVVAQLPNPMGSNEVPVIYGRSTADTRMGVFKRGDYIDGEKAGQPYLENRHTVVMEKSGATFSIPIHVGYDKVTNSDGTVKFVMDKNSPKAPFLGGRVSILVKGVEVANDRTRNHATKGGVSIIQPISPIAIHIAGKEYFVLSGQADLDNHEISVKFDPTKTEPDEGDVEVCYIFDYERKDALGKYILNPPGLDMTFDYVSLYASPWRSKLSASIDAITQMQNELNISWSGAVLATVQQKYYLEQTARLLREQIRACMLQGDRVHVYDVQKTGVHFTSMETMFSTIKATLGRAKAKLTTALNLPVGAVDIFVGDVGAAFFNGLPESMYEPTGASYGDNSSIYRIGSLKGGTNIYYVPVSLAVFDESKANNTATALMLPRATTPALSPFVGHTAVAPMILTAKPDAFEEQVAIYGRTAADRNPHPAFNNQGILIQLLNIPNI